MLTVALIFANSFFLAIVIIGVILERRLSRLEFERADADAREESAYFDLAFEIDALSKRLNDLSPAENVDDDKLRAAAAAEKRFSEGVASILGYDLSSAVPLHGHLEPDSSTIL